MIFRTIKSAFVLEFASKAKQWRDVRYSSIYIPVRMASGKEGESPTIHTV